MLLQDANPTPSFGGFGVMLKDSRDIAVVHRLAPQMPSSSHCLEERTLGYA